MKLVISAGEYIVAVSGGVDSMVLLDVLSKKPKLGLVVAHFNHGIRKDSAKDEELVAITAAKYGLSLEVGYGKLGENAGEDKARAARYEFLWAVKKKYRAKAIITAHHQDDLIETAIINLIRGTGRRGLTSLAQNPDVIRPLLGTPKKELLEYAKEHNLKWRYDITNRDTRYLRNYIRLNIVPRLTDKQRTQLLSNIAYLSSLNPILDNEIATLSQTVVEKGTINRQKFINLPHEIAREVLAHFLRRENLRQFDNKTLERLTISIKTAKAGTSQDVFQGASMKIARNSAHLIQGVKV